MKKEIGLNQDDFRWLKIRTLLLLGRTREALPGQGAYNAGQKMFALLVYTAVPVIMITGLIMTFHLGGAFLVAWAMVLHFLAVGMVVSGLMIHVYMGAVFPEERPAFYSMITGMVNELHAYRHHFKWWRELKMEQRAWEQELETDSGGGEVASRNDSVASAPEGLPTRLGRAEGCERNPMKTLSAAQDLESEIYERQVRICKAFANTARLHILELKNANMGFRNSSSSSASPRPTSRSIWRSSRPPAW